MRLDELLNLTNPGAAVIAAATGGTLAPDALEQGAGGGAQTPVSEAHRAEPAPIDVRGALQALQQNFQAWSRRHGGQVDPFASAQAQGTPQGGAAMVAPSLVTHAAAQGGSALEQLLGGVASVNQRAGSAREGQALQEYDLGGGQFAHVYYDSKGRRKVFKFRR